MTVSHWFELSFQSDEYKELNFNISTEVEVDLLQKL